MFVQYSFLVKHYTSSSSVKLRVSSCVKNHRFVRNLHSNMKGEQPSLYSRTWHAISISGYTLTSSIQRDVICWRNGDIFPQSHQEEHWGCIACRPGWPISAHQSHWQSFWSQRIVGHFRRLQEERADWECARTGGENGKPKDKRRLWKEVYILTISLSSCSLSDREFCGRPTNWCRPHLWE